MGWIELEASGGRKVSKPLSVTLTGATFPQFLWEKTWAVRARCERCLGLKALSWFESGLLLRVFGGALVVKQSIYESEFPPSVRLTPATFPQGGRLSFGSCFAVAGVVGWDLGAVYIESEVSISLSLWDISPPRGIEWSGNHTLFISSPPCGLFLCLTFLAHP